MIILSFENLFINRKIQLLQATSKWGILSADETIRVQIVLKNKDLAYWDKTSGGWTFKKDK